MSTRDYQIHHSHTGPESACLICGQPSDHRDHDDYEIEALARRLHDSECPCDAWHCQWIGDTESDSGPALTADCRGRARRRDHLEGARYIDPDAEERKALIEQFVDDALGTSPLGPGAAILGVVAERLVDAGWRPPRTPLR